MANENETFVVFGDLTFQVQPDNQTGRLRNASGSILVSPKELAYFSHFLECKCYGQSYDPEALASEDMADPLESRESTTPADIHGN